VGYRTHFRCAASKLDPSRTEWQYHLADWQTMHSKVSSFQKSLNTNGFSVKNEFYPTSLPELGRL